MNNLKFRAWHKTEKKMYSVSVLDFDHQDIMISDNGENFYDIVPMAATLLSVAKSETQKAIIQRKQLELIGIEQAEILRLVPYTLDELKARTLLELLSNNDEAGLVIEDIMQEDHQVYIDIFRQGNPTEMVNKGINNRLMALEYRERRLAEQMASQNEENQGQLNAMANIGTAQLANNAISQKMSEKGNPALG